MNGYLAVNLNGEYVIFNGKPIRCKEPIMITDTSKIIEDLYGKIHHPLKESGKYEIFWGIPISSSINKYDRGAKINPSWLAVCLQDRKWDDDPVNLNKILEIK